jgi:hypothetical protein
MKLIHCNDENNNDVWINLDRVTMAEQVDGGFRFVFEASRDDVWVATKETDLVKFIENAGPVLV